VTRAVSAAGRGAPPARWLFLAGGSAAAVVAAAAATDQAGSAARQDWPPFLLVTGLLVLGQVAWEDGLFQAAGEWIGSQVRHGAGLLLASAVLVALVTAVLNLDTSVAFLTPVLLHAARRRRITEAPLLYLSIFLANGASLLLPGSNLTNLIVLGRVHESGADFARHMLPVWLAASAAITVVVLVAFRRELAPSPGPATEPIPRPRLGVGLAGVVAAIVAVVVLPPAPMALAVAGLGAAAMGRRLWERRIGWRRAAAGLNLPVVIGLFGLAVALGTLGRVWSGPADLLARMSSWESAAFAGLLSAVCNNLPAASLLAARPPKDPYALLIGLNLGPNLVVTGALAGLLWLQVGRLAGGRPSWTRMTRLGLVIVPVSMAAALAALAAAH
jgi:arsenical pump membrane protein